MKDITLFDALCEADQIRGLGRAEAKIRGFVNLIEVLRSGLSSYTLPDLIKSLLERIDYAEYLRDQDEESAEDRLGNVDELITKAAVYEETHDEPSLSEFLEEIMLVADIDNVEARGQVKLGGMEWTARSTSGDPISVGTEVRVDRVEGVKVYVTPVEAAVTV